MTINVLGASGQLGRHVVQALLDQGAAPGDLSASVRSPDNASGLAARGVAVRHADYDAPDTLREAFQGTDILLLIPTSAPVEPRILQHAHALQAAREAGVRRVVFVSVSAAEPTSLFSVAPFLLYAESALRQSGMEWTILRTGMYLDPVAEWAPTLVETSRLPYPVARGRVAYITREDIARALAAACLTTDHAGTLYELTGPEAVSMPELAQALSHATGAPIAYEHVTEEAYAESCRADGVPEPLVEVLVTMYRAVDNGEFGRVTGDVEALTGRPAQTVRAYLDSVLRRDAVEG
ncbi:Quinone oxidoreductase 2 [Planctomycetes bacterium Poly30]|uniref:Quinone oxidoreductase 2 n=1 Tax=Saltatorellus ferox TaxID=2528018 RepID=A0A518EUP2_9BACT|nr:Quinone oxidoreductase 2 [Planctomycetes bacterium Poly30]